MTASDEEKRLRSSIDNIVAKNSVLTDSEPWIWSELSRGASSRNHPWNLGCLSTILQEADGSLRPRSRTVVLRDCDVKQKTLDFHTDLRSTKMLSLLGENSRELCWLFYRHETRVQLRMDAHCRVLDADEQKPIWEKTPKASIGVYASIDPPGSLLPRAGSGDFSSDHEIAEKNFCVVRTQIHHVDLVILSPTGNRRLCIDYPNESDSPEVQWLVP